MWVYSCIVFILLLFLIEYYLIRRLKYNKVHGEINKLFIPNRKESINQFFFECTCKHQPTHEIPVREIIDQFFFECTCKHQPTHEIPVREIILLDKNLVFVISKPYTIDHDDIQIKEVILKRRADRKTYVVGKINIAGSSVVVETPNDMIIEMSFHRTNKMLSLKVMVTTDYSVNEKYYSGTIQYGG